MKGVFIAFTLYVLGMCSLWGQTAQLQKANKYYRELNFQQAIPLYERMLQKQIVPQAMFNLADCYRRVGNTLSAEYWYAQSSVHPEATPEIHFYLGLMRLSNGKVREALTSFEKFRELEPGDSRSLRLIQACKDSVRNELLNAGILYQVRQVAEVNTEYDEFSPVFYDKGFVFASDRDTGSFMFRRSAWTGRSFVDVYYVPARLSNEEKMEFSYGAVEKFDLNTKWHDGPLSFTPDQQKVFLSRNRLNKGRVERDKFGIMKVDIVEGRRSGDTWTDFKALPFSSPSYSVLHPSMSADGTRLYFTSDMEGGFGGLDLYVAYRDGNVWSSPINLGPSINTEGDEVFPFVDSTGTLYFSSDGHTGLGGFDVYFSKATKGIWAPIKNVGAPINSPKDDVGFVLHPSRKFGYIASNRDGGAGNTDLYYFTKLTVQVEILVFDKNSGKGIEGLVLRSPCLPRDTFVTNVEGRINVEVPIEYACRFEVMSEPFAGATLDVSTKGYPIGSELQKSLPLEMDKLNFAVEGQVLDQADGSPISGVMAVLLSSCSGTEEKIALDAQGKYNFNLQPNCCYVVKVSKDGYFTGTDQFCTKGKFKSDTLESKIELLKFFKTGDKPGGGSSLRGDSKYVIDNIYYETGSAELRSESFASLDQVYELMLNNPNYSVEIGSHTDSRGGDNLNLNLSMRRAKAVADYLVRKGIARERVQHIGFGEFELLNHCKDGVSCSEAEHQVNRRTEFRIYEN